MSQTNLNLVFAVGASPPGSVSHRNYPLAFQLGRDIPYATRVSLPLVFAVRGLGMGATRTLSLFFLIAPPPATVFVFDNGWQPEAQRVYSTSGWYPGV